MMQQLRDRLHPHHRTHPPALATDGKRAYEEAMVETWGQVPPYKGRGKRPKHKKPLPDWQYVRIIKNRDGHRLVCVDVQFVFGDWAEVYVKMGAHTAYVERTFLTSRQMNARLVRKTLSFSKQVARLEDACAWEDWAYNLTRPCQSLREEDTQTGGRWHRRSPAMAAGLTDHIWTVKELLMTVCLTKTINSP